MTEDPELLELMKILSRLPYERQKEIIESLEDMPPEQEKLLWESLERLKMLGVIAKEKDNG